MLIGIDAHPLLGTRPSGIEVYLAELVRLLPVVAPQHRYRLYFNYVRSRHNERIASFSGGNVETRACRIPPQILGPLHRYAGLPIDWLAGRVNLMFYPSFAVQPQWHGRAVVTVHDLIPLTHPEFCEARHVRDFAARVPRSLSRADAIIAVSRYTADAMSNVLGMDRERVYIVPNGIHEQFRQVAGSGGSLETARRLGIDGPYVLFVGNHEPRKNLPRLLKAYGAMKPAVRRHHRLVLAGSKEGDEAAIAAAIAEVPADSRVIQLGHVAAADLPGLYYGASAFCFPSLVEGFGIPPLEAMASGCPVLAADIPALREVLGDAAMFADPFSVDALRDGLERVLEDAELQSALRERGARQAADFSWERTARETVSVFERIAGRGHG